jgi:hypothetical protein
VSQSINWGELLEQSGGAFEPLPKGTYDVYVDTAEATKSSTDKVMFKVRFKVEGGPYAGRTVYNNITLTTDNPNALRMFFLNMKAMGLDQSYFAENPHPDTVAAALVGQRATVSVDHGIYHGQMRENVKSLMPRAGGISAAGIISPGIQVAPPVASGGPIVPTPGANPMVPSGMHQSASVVSQPAPQPAPATVEPPAVESTVNIPAPSNPAPSADTAAPALPPGMTPEMLAQFQAFQAAQVAQTAAPASETSAQPAVPAGAPPFPLPDSEAF